MKKTPALKESLSKFEFPVPKARNAKAQGNALGQRRYELLSAESAQWRVGE